MALGLFARCGTGTEDASNINGREGTGEGVEVDLAGWLVLVESGWG